MSKVLYGLAFTLQAPETYAYVHKSITSFFDLRAYMLNRIPKNIPPLEVLLHEIGARPRDAAKALKVSTRTVERWLKNHNEPWAVRVAFFWITRWGRSAIDADTTNEARIFSGLARAQAEEIKKLRRQIAWMMRNGTFGAANDPINAHLEYVHAFDYCEVLGVDRHYQLPHSEEVRPTTGSEQLRSPARL